MPECPRIATLRGKNRMLGHFATELQLRSTFALLSRLDKCVTRVSSVRHGGMRTEDRSNVLKRLRLRWQWSCSTSTDRDEITKGKTPRTEILRATRGKPGGRVCDRWNG